MLGGCGGWGLGGGGSRGEGMYQEVRNQKGGIPGSRRSTRGYIMTDSVFKSETLFLNYYQMGPYFSLL